MKLKTDMNIIFSAGISFFFAVASIFGIVNYVPISVLERPSESNFGSSITTINGSDTLSSSRTVINDNFAALNLTKIEVSTTTLPLLTTLTGLATVGTITTGTWNATAIAVSKGGTGTTSPTTNQVMLGDSTNGFKVVNGFGTSGQILTSNGSASAPTWQTGSIDQTGNFNFTGNTYIKNLFASSTVANPMTLNGLGYSLPSVRAASSTVLMENGSGSLSWNPVYPIVLQDYVTRTVTMTSHFNNYTIRENYGLGTFNVKTTDSFRVSMHAGVDTSSGSEALQIIIGNGTASTTVYSKTQASNYYDAVCTIDIYVKGATNNWDYFTECLSHNGSGVFLENQLANSTVDISTGFNIVASSTESTQDGLTGSSQYLRVERIR